MKIIVYHDDGKEEVYQEVTDAYLAVRQHQPMASKEGQIALLPETRSYSWGNNLRELVKELYQSQTELQEIIKNANTTRVQ